MKMYRISDAYTLDDLASENKNPKFHDRVNRCTPLSIRYEPESDRYLFHVRCFESWSSYAGHIVSILFDNETMGEKGPYSVDVRVFCSCPAWLYYGSKYTSTQADYNLSEHTESRFPFIRDPGLINTTCKHVLTVRRKVLQNLKMTDLRKKYKTDRAMGITTSDRKVGFEEFCIRETLASLDQSTVDDCKGAVDSFLKANGVTDSFRDNFLLELDPNNFEERLESMGMLVQR